MSPAASQLFRQQAYIDGQWLEAPDGAHQDIYNPASG
jgi:succinate-semialdehyde dehydrogenase/glutarate-semialdehyde dehydrogenase